MQAHSKLHGMPILAGLSAGILVAGLLAAWEANSSPYIPPAPPLVSVPELPNAGGLYPFKADALPTDLIIPSLGITTEIESVGLAPDGSMGVLQSYTKVGWFNQGPFPGALGIAVVEGHYDSDKRSSPYGVFYHLEDLKPGDEVLVRDAAQRIIRFSVIESKSFPYDAHPEEVFGPAAESRLNLVTCGGAWIKSKRTYDKRLVVFTKRIE